MRLLLVCIITVSACGFSGCMVQRTVTDGRGNLIYQEPSVVNPFGNPQNDLDRARSKGRKLGW